MRTFSIWLLACALLASAGSARALSLDEMAAHYTKLNDVGFVNLFGVTASVVAETDLWPLTLLGHDIRYEITVGQFFGGHDSKKDVTIVYAGPTWRYHPTFLWSGGYIDFGSAVSYLTDKRVGDTNLGGRFEFTSHLTLGHQFGQARRWRVGLRLQHTSNADLHSRNPGLDALMLEVGYRFGADQTHRGLGRVDN